ncbi:MAG: sigma factor-like helix-turn-helix DNA-binding protein [Peptoniphilus sp.]|nr:sigma factor-like helix-turn-helix DNA-binding protein [Peptoniphilus sp.]MDD7363367.1 sigma factor-like helix-turn-helix DNA-binding protein [Bacillota bacterium]MDY6044286.1 sigma factor-like helix-turn-helix DNA-binding protein [Peptoniphilus sp.]
MDKTIQINVLLDLYDQLLSKKQRQVMDLYYREDYSLNEISDIVKTSKQAVSENIKRAESALNAYESTLGLAEKNRKWNEDARLLGAQLEKLRAYSDDPKFLEILSSIESRIEKEGYYDI